MRSLVITWDGRRLIIARLPVAAILQAGHDLTNAAYTYDPGLVHQAANRWHDLGHPAAHEHLVCVLFGHTGDATDSGYHICGRCSLHAYWHTPEGNPEATANYDHAAIALRPWWALCDALAWLWAARPWRKDDLDIPF